MILGGSILTAAPQVKGESDQWRIRRAPRKAFSPAKFAKQIRPAPGSSRPPQAADHYQATKYGHQHNEDIAEPNHHIYWRGTLPYVPRRAIIPDSRSCDYALLRRRASQAGENQARRWAVTYGRAAPHDREHHASPDHEIPPDVPPGAPPAPASARGSPCDNRDDDRRVRRSGPDRDTKVPPR